MIVIWSPHFSELIRISFCFPAFAGRQAQKETLAKKKGTRNMLPIARA
jgi:hypothetical protein